MIHVYKRPLDIGKYFDLVLELLADVVRLPKRCVSRHNNIHFNKVVWSALWIILEINKKN